MYFPVPLKMIHGCFGQEKIMVSPFKGEYGGELLIVPLNLFIAKPAKQARVAFPHNGYGTVNHAVTIMCANRTERLRQIRDTNVAFNLPDAS